MTDTQNTDTREAVAVIDGTPHFELSAAEWIIPTTVATPDGDFKLYCHMRPYVAHAIKQFYDQLLIRRKQRSASEVSLETLGFDDIEKFVLDHITGMTGAQLTDGTAPTLDQVKAWLRENSRVMRRIFTEGVDQIGVRNIKVQDAESPKAVVLLFGEHEVRIPMRVTLYSKAQQAEVTVNMTMVMDRLTESDRHQYDKAISVIENSRRAERYVETNWDVVELLCNQRAKRFEGVTLDGVACTELNKGDAKSGWIGRVPFIMKIYAMGQAVQQVDVKNG